MSKMFPGDLKVPQRHIPSALRCFETSIDRFPDKHGTPLAPHVTPSWNPAFLSRKCKGKQPLLGLLEDMGAEVALTHARDMEHVSFP